MCQTPNSDPNPTNHSSRKNDTGSFGSSQFISKLPQKLQMFLDPTMFRFIIVGVINTLFGTGIMFFCYQFLHLGYWISSGANYFFGSILSFYLNKHFTFRSSEKGPKVVLKFVLNIIVCWLLAYGAAQPLTFQLLQCIPTSNELHITTEIKETVAMLVGMILFTLLNYFGQRFFTFSSKKD